jgi:hypothetical protein
MIQRGRDEFRHPGVGRENGNSQLSFHRKFICTDLLNYYGLWKLTILRFLSTTSPFSQWEFCMSNDEFLFRRIGRERGEG